MNGLSFFHTIGKWLWRVTFLVLGLAALSTTIVAFAHTDLSGWPGSHGIQTIALASASDSSIVDPTSPKETIKGLTSLQDLEGLPCQRGWNEVGKVDVTYDQITGEIHLWCNPVSVHVAGIIQSSETVTSAL
jgi:hypothetical protein